MKSISTPAWLCDKSRVIHHEGQEGIFSFDGAEFRFTSLDKDKTININTKNLKLADLNNIMAGAEIILSTIDGASYVFVTTRPASNTEAYSRALFVPRLLGNVRMFKGLSNSVQTSSKWKKIIIDSLPASQVHTRKEIRIGFVILWSVIAIVGLFLILFMLVVLLSGRA